MSSPVKSFVIFEDERVVGSFPTEYIDSEVIDCRSWRRLKIIATIKSNELQFTQPTGGTLSKVLIELWASPSNTPNSEWTQLSWAGSPTELDFWGQTVTLKSRAQDVYPFYKVRLVPTPVGDAATCNLSIRIIGTYLPSAVG